MWSRCCETGTDRADGPSAFGMGSLRGVKRFEGGQYSVSAGIDAGRGNVGPADHAFLVDDEEDAFADAVGGLVNAILAGDLSLWLKIRQQGEMQLAALRVGDVAPDAIDGQAD